MADLVYALCAITSLACASLLLRGYVRTHARLLLWSGLCFCLLFVNNVMLIIDIRVFPEMNLSIWRTLPALLGIGVLVYGLIWDAR